MRRKSLYLSLLCPLLFTGCATYHLSTEELLTQFADSRKETKITIIIAPPYFFFPGIVSGNSLRTIDVHDKKDGLITLPVTNHTSVRITKAGGSRTTFYFNTLLLEDSTITGSKTHFFNMQIKPILFRDINKIELQRH